MTAPIKKTSAMPYRAQGIGFFEGEKVRSFGMPAKTVVAAVVKFVAAFGELPEWVSDGEGRVVWSGRYRLRPDSYTPPGPGNEWMRRANGRNRR